MPLPVAGISYTITLKESSSASDFQARGQQSVSRPEKQTGEFVAGMRTDRRTDTTTLTAHSHTKNAGSAIVYDRVSMSCEPVTSSYHAIRTVCACVRARHVKKSVNISKMSLHDANLHRFFRDLSPAPTDSLLYIPSDRSELRALLCRLEGHNTSAPVSTPFR